jgi:hypothetical protein
MRKVLLFTYFIILVDVILTLKELVGLRKLVIKLQKTSEEMVNGLMKKIENKGDFYLLDFLNDAKANIKQKMNYRKVEQFQGFSEFLDEMTNKGKEWKLDNEILTEHFRDVLGKIKRNARFYKNYPNAKTRHFHMMFVTRKLDFIVQEIKRQLSNKD